MGIHFDCDGSSLVLFLFLLRGLVLETSSLFLKQSSWIKRKEETFTSWLIEETTGSLFSRFKLVVT